jgi:DNA-binding NarL/FixJ family response regulator
MRRTIVIVDDHGPFRRSARRLLELDGFEVVGEAFDCSTGERLVRSTEPDVVLLDVALPDGSGLDVAERLSGGPATIVLVSSRDPDDLGSRLGTCGAAGFIPKDELTGERLTELLRRVA